MRCFYFLLLTGFFTSCGIDKEFDHKVIRVDIAWRGQEHSAPIHNLKVNSDLYLSYRVGDSLCWLGKIDSVDWERIIRKVNRIDLRYLPEHQPRFRECEVLGLVFYNYQGVANQTELCACTLPPDLVPLIQELKKLAVNPSLKQASIQSTDTTFFPYFQIDHLFMFRSLNPPPFDPLMPPPPPPPKMYMEPTFKSKTEKARYDSTMKKVKEYESEH